MSARKSPYAIEGTAGETYYWCACGKTAKPPLCDGSHAGSGVSPIAHKAEKSGTIYFCGCRASQKGALCDGSHKKL